MVLIKDIDRSIFSNLVRGSINFNEDEIGRIGNMAKELKSIIDAALRREQDRLRQYNK